MPTKAKDFGAVRRFTMIHVIAAVLVLTLGVGLVTWNAVRGRKVDVATAQAWDIKGPPCAQLTLEQWNAKHLKVRDVTNYDGRMIGRWSGDVSCSDVKDSGGAGFGTDRICQFTNPTALAVTTPAGAFYFETGTGQPATLSLHQDKPKCVLASKFTRATE